MSLKKLTTLSSVFLLLITPQISAQEANSNESADEIETVIVTATRRETDLMETPIAVSAITDEELTRLGLSNITDLSYALPGLAIQQTDTNAPIITLRGVRSNNVTEVGDPAVGIHVDGVYVARPQGAQALMFDLEQAELLRGPQGTLFGRNSIVGTLNIRTAKPNLDVQGGSLIFKTGRFNEEGVRGHYNLPINDKLAFRFAFMTEAKDSFLDGYYDGAQVDWRFLPDTITSRFTPITDQSQKTIATQHAGHWGCQSWQIGCWSDPGWQLGVPPSPVEADPEDFYNNVDQNAFRLSALYIIDETSDLNLQYEVYHDKGAGWTNLASCEIMQSRTGKTMGDPAVYPANTCTDLYGSEDKYRAFVNVPGKNDLEIESFRAIYTKDFGDYDLKARLGRQQLEQYSQFDVDGGINAGWDMAMVIDDFKAESTVIDIQLSNKSSELAWVVGAFYLKEDNDMHAYFHATYNGDDIYHQPNREIESTAIFGQATYSISDKLFLTLGARYTEDEKSDNGGKNYACVVWNGCYPNTELWAPGGNDDGGNAIKAWAAQNPVGRFGFMPALNQLAPNFHIQSGLIDGVNCSAAKNPYEIWPYYFVSPQTTGCIVETLNNTTSASFDSTDWRIGLDYDLSDTSFLYTYLATGFKAGSITDVYVRGENSTHPEGPGSAVDTSYGPEEAVTFEVGYKARLLDNKLNIALNYFMTEYDGKQFTGNVPVDTVKVREFDIDLQQTVEVDQVVTIWGTQNFGEQEMSGLEFEFDYIPYDGGRLSGWATTMDTEIVEDYNTQWYYAMDAQFGRAGYAESVANVPENAVNLKGNEAPYSPDFAVTLKYEHTFNLGSWGTLNSMVNWHWQSEDYLTIWNADKHVNDPGGYGTGSSLNDDPENNYYDFVDLPGYFADPVEQFGDKRDSWHMMDFIMTYKPAGDSSWYLQAAIYNLEDESIPWFRAVEAGVPRGAYSAPRQYVLSLGYYW
jgi:iron complex outermembrane receptor protein